MQRVEIEDIITLQIHATTAAASRVIFYTETGLFVKAQLANIFPLTIAGNAYYNPNTNTSEQLYTHHFNISFVELLQAGLMPATGGTYRIAIELKWNANGADIVAEQRRQLVSNLLFVRKKWPETVMIEAKHRQNKDGFIWQQTAGIVALRLPATLTQSAIEAGADIYEDGGDRPTLLNANPYDTYRLLALSVPEFMLRKLNLLFDCSDIAVDGKRVVRPASSGVGENYSRTRTIDTQLRLQRPETEGGFSFAIKSPYGTSFPPGATYIFTLPAGYPYTITTLKTGPIGGTLTGFGSEGATIINKAQRDAAILSMNLSRRTIAALYGRFVLIGLDVVFMWSELAPRYTIQGTIIDNSGGTISPDPGNPDT